MMMPSIFGENLFDDDWMSFPFESDFWGKRNPLYGKNAKNMMKTDIREHDQGYEIDIDLPGFKKEEISAQLEDCLLYTSHVILHNLNAIFIFKLDTSHFIKGYTVP